MTTELFWATTVNDALEISNRWPKFVDPTGPSIIKLPLRYRGPGVIGSMSLIPLSVLPLYSLLLSHDGQRGRHYSCACQGDSEAL